MNERKWLARAHGVGVALILPEALVNLSPIPLIMLGLSVEFLVAPSWVLGWASFT